MDVQAALSNVLLVLQEDPRRYRWFGIYWWPVKALLKGAGYTRENLFLLGDYQDADTAERVPDLGLHDTLTAALREYGHNARFPRSDGMVEDEDGSLVVIIDEDAGGL